MKNFTTKLVFFVFLTVLCAWNLNAQSFNVTLTAEPTHGGGVVGNGVYDEGMSILVVAVPSPFFDFCGWSDENGEMICLEEEYRFVVTEDCHLIANFCPSTISFEVSLSANPQEYGTVSGGGFLYNWNNYYNHSRSIF